MFVDKLIFYSVLTAATISGAIPTPNETLGPCERFPCGMNAKCTPSDPPQCLCLPGFKGDAQLGCVDIDECSGLPCAYGAHCINEKGGFTCICPHGMTGDAYRSGCIGSFAPKGECATDDECVGQLTCVNGACINPCNNLPCGPNAYCEPDGNHAAWCICQVGFAKNSNGECVSRAIPTPNETLECGVIDRTLPVANRKGEEAIPYEHPWNAALYFEEENQFNRICSATLITRSLILTAAYCTQLPGKNTPSDTIETKKFKIGLGKKFDEYNSSADLPTAQYFDVDKIYVSNVFNEDHYQFSEIAIIKLKCDVNINSYVRPVCIDKDKKYQLTSNLIGKAVGWRLKEEGETVTPSLREINITYSSWEECNNKMNVKLTRDKFCAFGTTEVPIKVGEGGTGLIFEFDGKNYIYGVASSGSDSEKWVSFNDLRIDSVLNFIKKIENEAT